MKGKARTSQKARKVEELRLEDSTPRRYTAVLTKEDKWYVAHCVELGVVSQGKTIEHAKANLKEAVELYLEDLPPDELPQSTQEVVLYPLEVPLGG